MRTKVWNTRTGQLARTFHHTQLTYTASWSPNGKTLAVTGHEDIVRFWDGETFEARGVLMKFRNGKHLAIGATGHYVGSPGIEHEIVYVVVTDAGQEMLTPEEFAGRFGWTNDPSKVKLVSSVR